MPNFGQWVDFGAGKPSIQGNSFAFSSNTTAGYFYTKIAAAAGQTLSLNYSINGSNPQWGIKDPTDIPPASITLFLWRSGDDLSCNGSFASYRFWHPKRNLLTLGANQTLSVPIDPNQWTNCHGQVDPAGFNAAIANALGWGYTFGGQKFFGHGVYLQNGNAQFFINSFGAGLSAIHR